MPSSLVPRLPPARARQGARRVLPALLGGGALVAALATGGCLGAAQLRAERASTRYYPPQPQSPRVVALGTLRGAPPPTQAQVDLTLFLFGAEPPPPLTIANPAGLASSTAGVWICDNALSTIFNWDSAADQVTELSSDPPLDHPFAVDVAPGGDRLVCDRRGVWRYNAGGHVVRPYRLEGTEFRPGGVLAVGDTVWVSNTAQDRIEVFDGASGQPQRSIGQRGHGGGQFFQPRSLARTPDGRICVVDMLNNRVQMLEADGTWVRDVGQAGDSVGSFGRPKDVAVGPDGTIFVTDAFSQRVHAFDTEGRPLLAFGEPGSGIGALALPAGIAFSARAPQTEQTLPTDLVAAYYVLVAEQLDRPGLRAYAWLKPGPEGAGTVATGGVANGRAAAMPSTAVNPHWDAARCTTCHKSAGDRMLPIPPESVDAGCLTCHDGLRAPRDPHPIGRPATTDVVVTPADWPVVNGDIGCLTCHDIRRHCQAGVKRPAVNSLLLRGFNAQHPLDYCGTCHRTEVTGRFSPHRQRDAQGKIREDACFFCHTVRPEIPADGRRRFEPHLRVESSELCLNCHAKHWDLSPLGHVDRPVTPRIREWMLVRELGATAADEPQDLARRAAESQRPPARLPLGGDKVTCYTCHNPHYTGLFPADSELGALASNPEDRRAALRTNWIDLCSQCHHH